MQDDSLGSLLDWDPFNNTNSSRQHLSARNRVLRSWYGSDGELVREFPCPDCRGRGYVVCSKCEVGNPEAACSECLGKGLKSCLQCLGKRAVWVKAVDEIPWGENQSCSPLQIEDDESIDHMEVRLAPQRKSKRVYTSLSMEVREKIRRALKTLDAQTGSVTRRMRRIHNDPIINAKRIAAIKQAKSSEASRRRVSEKLRLYFQNPENRFQRSLVLKGVDFHCGYCGGKGHRRHYCPDLPEAERKKQTPRTYRCSLCNELGHKRTTCWSNLNRTGKKMPTKMNAYRCGICKEAGHNARTCQKKSGRQRCNDTGG